LALLYVGDEPDEHEKTLIGTTADRA